MSQALPKTTEQRLRSYRAHNGRESLTRRQFRRMWQKLNREIARSPATKDGAP